jgi:hypothetical protein
MDVRLARPTDAALVLSLALDASSHIVKGFGWATSNDAVRALIRASLPLGTRGRAWIARDRENIALLEAEPRQYVIGWDINRLAVRGEDVDETVACVIGAAVCHLQNRGVPRMFARTTEDRASYLRPLGFHALAREYVLLSPMGHESGSASPPPDSRYRMPQDSWPLHQLESEVTPPLVRQLEGLTSLDWSRPVRRMTEIVVEGDGHVVAWISWGARLGPHHRGMTMLLHPDHKELADVLIRHALAQGPDDSRFVARVRDYHVHALRAFIDAGFSIESEEVLLVKHAGVELAPAFKPRLAVNTVPSISGFNVHLRRRVCTGEYPEG